MSTKVERTSSVLIIVESSLNENLNSLLQNSHSRNLAKPIGYGALAAIGLIAVYFVAVGLISEPAFAREQFARYWYFIVSLAAGFGIQIGLYAYLRGEISGMHGEGKVLGVTGTTSTAAMISCCAHYLANLLPILGTVGIVTFVAQYQVEFFWVGLLFNLGGIIYIASRVIKFKRA